jgi:hypothetical protein
MAVEIPQGDLARTTVHEPNSDYPDKLRIQLIWIVKGRRFVRSIEIPAGQFFGRGTYGAPLGGGDLIQYIEIMRRKGRPEPAVKE